MRIRLLSGLLTGPVILFAAIDAVLGLLFAIAHVRTGGRMTALH
jgi:hypothetical protein